MTVTNAADVKVPARKAGTPRTAPAKPSAPKTAAPKSAPVAAPVVDPVAELARLKEELAAARAAVKANKAAKKSEHESGYRGALTKPVEGKVADFCRWAEKNMSELGQFSERDERIVLVTLRAYGAFQAEVNNRTAE